MQRIGVVGPRDSVTRILEVAQCMRDEVELVPFIFKDFRETSEIIRRNLTRMRGWLFSGPTPYMRAVHTVGKMDNFDYCSFSDAGLYKCFLQIGHEKGKVLERISLDISTYENLQEAIDELKVPLREVYINYYDSDADPMDLIRRHIDLWSAGKIDAAISGLSTVCEFLKKDGRVPAYRNNATAKTIREAVNRLLQKIATSYFKDAQVGFEIIEVLDFDGIARKSGSPYDLRQLELKISQRLLILCERLNGYLLERGRGIYEISSSRGAIERGSDLLGEVIDHVSGILGVEIAVGIGFGDSVFSAQRNARQALENAKKRDRDRIVVVEDTGTLVEIRGGGKLRYEAFSDDAALMAKLKDAGVGVKTFKKIEAVVRSRGWSSFTTVLLAAELGVTERNARRILSALHKAGMIELVGSRNPAARGRPSGLYRFA